MNLFDQLVDQALEAQNNLAPLRAVVEKELLHHDILREMAQADLLHGLTFIGGTCLRACYGSHRLSEDLDFTGGQDFDRATLSTLGGVLVERLEAKYGLAVTVNDPVRDSGSVDTWKLRMTTRPAQKDLSAQRIHIDICAIPSYQKRPMLLRNPYGVDMGTGGLILQVQSREEILADKLVALALRPNRLKHRDLWDISWLRQQNVDLPLELIPNKIADHNRTTQEFLELLEARRRHLLDDATLRLEFINEISRFLPPAVVAETVEQEAFWDYLANLVSTECGQVTRYLSGEAAS